MKLISIKKIGLGIAVFLLLAAMLSGVDSRQNPVMATYCDGTTLALYPYSFVVRDDKSSFSCYEVQVSPAGEGTRFGFEDAGDHDYNDIIIDLWLTGNNSSAPVAHVRFVSKDAAYSHTIHLVSGSNDLPLFKAEETFPGTVFDIPLPIRPCPDFILTANPTFQTTPAGGSLKFEIQAESRNGFKPPLTLSLSGAPAGFNHSFTPNPFNPGSRSVLEIKTEAQMVPGNYPLTITATGGNVVHTTTVIVEVKGASDFSIHASPPQRSVYKGEATFYTIVVQAQEGFKDNVALSVEGLPSGATASFDPNPVMPTAEAKLNIQTTADTPSGSYEVTIKGSGGGKTRSIAVALEVKGAPYFTIHASPPQRSVYKGEATFYTIVVQAQEGFKDNVALSVEGLPSDATASFDPNPVMPTVEAKLNIQTTADTPSGSYEVTIKGSGGGKTHSTAVALEVKGVPDFILTASPAAQTIPAGGSLQFQVLAESSNGFAQPLALSLSGAPAGFSHSFTPNPFQPGSQSVLEIMTEAKTVQGSYPLTIMATGGGVTHTTTVTVEVTPPIPGFLEKTFSLSQSYPGQQIEMTLLLKNNSGIDFQDIVLFDDLPAFLLYLDDDASPKAEHSGSRISWFFRRLEKHSQIAITVKVKITDNCPPGEISNLAYFQHSLLSKFLASNSARIKIEEFQIQIKKTVNRDQARPGELLDYQILIHNLATQPLPTVRLKDTLAAELELVSQQSGLAFQQQGAMLLWTGDIGAGKEISASFQARVRNDAVAGRIIVNSASLESSLLAETLLSNTVRTTVVSDPIPTSQVRFSKKANTPQSEVGRIIRFRLLMENHSASFLLSPRLEDILPQGFDYVPGSSECDGFQLADPLSRSRLNWQIPAISPGQVSILSYQVVIGADVRRGRNVNRAVFNTQDQSGQNLQLEAEEFVNISTTTIVFYCAVEGSVFLDRDKNEFYSPADTPLPGIEMRLSNGQQALTDANGRYSFQSLFPGDYALGLNRATLPEKYQTVFPFTKVVTLFDGLTDTVDFAVTFKGDDKTLTCRLQGRVFFDKTVNQVFDAGEPLLSDFKVMLDDSLQTSGADGSFVFSKLPPGKHNLSIIYNGQAVRRDVTLLPGQNSLDFPLPFNGIVITIKGEN